MERFVYPFTAIVGQDKMKLALILNAIHPAIGGVLIRGEKGTGKSTAVRALARLLPEQTVVADCIYRCDPDATQSLCSDCRDRLARGESLPRARRQMRVVELPINASEDRVVGAIDIEAAIKSGERRFEPGVLAEANRNILYVDEVNLLDDHLVDVLLDAAAMGVNVVEREGISIWHPARFILVGTMNPEEGDLRPQLLDRFGLTVDVEGIKDINQRVQIVERREEWESDPAGFSQRYAAEDAEIGRRIADAIARFPTVVMPPAILRALAELNVSLQVDGHRADLVGRKAAQALAAYRGVAEVSVAEINEVADMVLAHRVKAGGRREIAGLQQTLPSASRASRS
jgi:magnesium chelatase subunit I